MQRILIADDHDENLYYLKVLLCRQNYEVTETRNGAEALESASVHKPDLIISDLLMPVMDGYTLLRRWKADPLLRQVPFVVYTATYTDTQDEQLALNLGADAFIVKPQEPETFMVRIREVLANAERGSMVPPRTTVREETGLLRQYSDVLIHKLEEKTSQLEEVNRALSAREAHLRAIIENSPNCVKLIDSKGVLLAINPAGWRMMEADCEEEIVGRCGYPVVVPECRNAFRDLTERVCRGESGSIEYEIVGLKGSRRWLAMNAAPLLDPATGLTVLLGITEDITERRMLEQQLRQAQKMEAVGRLAGGVAHDFNNILSVILGFSELAAGKLGAEHKAAGNIAEIVKAARRAASLTRQMLVFSRQQTIFPKVLNLNEVIKNVSKMITTAIGEDITLSFKLGMPLGSIKCDVGQIEQILMNLAVNARDAMPNGGQIMIQTQDAALDEVSRVSEGTVLPCQFVMLSVSDTGCGMDAATQAKIFEPFFTTKGPGKGTGLGLSTVYGIVKQNGGHICVDSKPQQGTTFRIYFHRDLQKPVSTSDRTEKPAIVGGTETILLVEDDLALGNLTSELLASVGYRVLQPQSTDEALQIALHGREPIHLLLTDVIMPKMNGVELWSRIKEANPKMRVIFISGYAGETLAQQIALVPDLALLEKPVSRDLLLKRVHEVLHNGDLPKQSCA